MIGRTACGKNPSKEGFGCRVVEKPETGGCRHKLGIGPLIHNHQWPMAHGLVCFNSLSLPISFQRSKIPTHAYCCSLHLPQQPVLTMMSTPEQSTPATRQAATDPPFSQPAKPQRVLACVLCQQRKVKCEYVFLALPISLFGSSWEFRDLSWDFLPGRLVSRLTNPPPKYARLTSKSLFSRKFPCANCTRSHAQCVPAATLVFRQRRRRFPERELLDRLRHYESLLRDNNIRFQPLHQDYSTTEKRSLNMDNEGRGDDSQDNEQLIATAGADQSSSPSTAVKSEIVYEAKYALAFQESYLSR